jgi:hypothetical protein
LGEHQVTRDIDRIEKSVGMAVIAYLVLIRARKQDIRPSRSWSIFQLQNNFTGDVVCNQLEHSMRLRFEKLMKAA